MFATLIEVKKSSSPSYWYADRIGEQFWIDMTYDNSGWFPCILNRTQFFGVDKKHIDYVIVAEADIDIVQAVQVNKLFAGQIPTGDTAA